ncbi:MAG: DUF2752 domain-containing protein [Clostridia bacterium]|nr:DUF2752 domain-containing protein [Clostridia bacterium]
MRPYKTVAALLLAVCVLLAFWVLGGRLCIFARITGYPCPGCGMTRAVLAVFRGDLGAAFSHHPLWVTLPVIALLLLRAVFPAAFDRMLTRISVSAAVYRRIESAAAVLLLAAFLLVYILRLTQGFR